jgi:hypothetical protein
LRWWQEAGRARLRSSGWWSNGQASRRILAGDFAEGETAVVDYAEGPDGRGEYAFEKAKEKAGAMA